MSRSPGRDGIASGITAAAVTITAAAPAGTGFVTVYPAGTLRPETSILNLQAGHDTANSGIVPVSASGAIDVYANVATHLIVDVTGTFTPTASATAGRFEPVSPTRLLDTRAQGGAALAPGGQITVALPSAVSADATAVAVNVTSVGAPTAGFFSAFPAGQAASNASFMNPDGSGAPRAAHVIVPVSSGGFTIATTSGGHVIVDLVGWFTGPSAAELRDRTVRADRADPHPRHPPGPAPGVARRNARASRGDSRRGGDRHQRHDHTFR